MDVSQAKSGPVSPREWRALFRSGEVVRPTTGLAGGFAQANLLVVPREFAFDFLAFCHFNAKACPLLEVGEPGDRVSRRFAPGADVCRDLPLYRVYARGEYREVTDAGSLWNSNSVFFLLGCSFSFEEALLRAGVPVRHVEEGRNCPIYVTSIDCVAVGKFRGKLVVSMRPIPGHLVARAVEVTARFPRAHGSPVHVGSPEMLGISDVANPDFGESVGFAKGDVPVFWACGVTSQLVAVEAGLPLVIAQAPGHMLIGDVTNEQLAYW